MKSLFKLNDTVMYGGHGVCTLIEIGEKDFGGMCKDYYVLQPAYSGSSTFFIPTDSEKLTAKLRIVKNAEEIKQIVQECRDNQTAWIDDDRQRQNRLKETVESGDTTALVSLFISLENHQRELQAISKKLRSADEKFMKDIEKLLCEEFSVSFDMEKEELLPYLFGECEIKEKEV